jgi:hypothetical protein
LVGFPGVRRKREDELHDEQSSWLAGRVVVTYRQVERFATQLPETVAAMSYGTPSLKVNRKFLARLRTEMADELDPDGGPYGEVLVLKLADLGHKAALLAADTAAFFTLPHYDGHASVLVRLDRVDPDELSELILESWHALAPRRAIALVPNEPRPLTTDPAE